MTETFLIGDQVFEIGSDKRGDREFTPGHYSCKVIEGNMKDSSKGDKQLWLKYRTEDGRWVFDFLTFGKTSSGIAGKKLKILGVFEWIEIEKVVTKEIINGEERKEERYDLNPFFDDPQKLIGTEVTLSLVPKDSYVAISKTEESKDFFMGYQVAPDIPF